MLIRVSLSSVLFALILVSAPVVARATVIDDCREAPNNQAAYECLKQLLESSELKLKHSAENLALVLKRIDGAYAPKIGAVRNLEQAHEKWMAYRNKECGFLGSVMMWGGSGSPQAILECLVKATDERARHYEELTDELTNTYLK